MQILIFIAGCVLGGVVVWILAGRALQSVKELHAIKATQLAERERESADLRQQLGLKQAELNDEQKNNKFVGEELAGVRAALQAAEEKTQLLADAEGRLSKTFAALSREALTENSGEFLKLAKTSFETEQKDAKGELKSKHDAFLQVIEPVGKTMIELGKSVERLSEDKERLANEARNLSTALRKADVRGRWGELHLERVVELAGLRNRCDFALQQTFKGEEDRRKRPDMVVNLPLERYVVVDSKAVMDAYITACDCADPIQAANHLVRHAQLVKEKVDELARIDYASVLAKNKKNVADMVVCFIPGEAFFTAAIAQDPTLLEHAARKRVFLASPTILITLLRAIGLGWRDHELSANAEHISQLGKELYTRLSSMKGHLDNVGDNLRKSVEHYNKMVGSLNSNVFPQARRFRDLKAVEEGAKEIGEGKFVEADVNRTDGADWEQPMLIAASMDETQD